METDQQPSAPDYTNATPGLVGVSVLFAVSLMAYGVRIYGRVRPAVRLAVPDYIITIALLCELIAFVCQLIAIRFGFGRYDYYLSPADHVKIMKPVMERILVIILMALGTIAAVAGAMKLVHSHAWDPRKNILRDWMPLAWWYRVEEMGLIAAACAPFLKPFIERMLSRFGVPQFRFVTIALRTIRSTPADAAEEVKESTSRQRTTEEQRLGPRNPDRLPSVVSSNSFDYRSDVAKPHGELASDQV
ncbi:hypothetical protein DL767_000491 [Monosporascus sp. MG133]|nr:hypothetical protein DL767_000491 [Monosporascus sp. MG133]